MTVRLPFTLTPLEGEDFVAWLHAYAGRLDVTPADLGDALGLSDRAGEERPAAHRHQRHVAAICEATGLPDTAVRALLEPATPAAAGRRGPLATTPRRDLSVIERLRHATTLAHDDRLRHATAVCRQRQRVTHTDPAIERARRLPDQLWPAWAIRLADDDAFEPSTFRSSALVALLVPHSALALREIAVLVSDRILPHTVGFHLRKLLRLAGDATALQILTELAFAIDRHNLPIDYARRRRLAATTELIDEHTWVGLARKTHSRHGRTRRAGFARCYLYELLTGGNLHLAPAPHRIDAYGDRIEYHDFVAGLPHALVDALHQHAEGLLTDAGITGEPLHWQPPAHWVSVTDWPGADPDHTDPDPIHRDLLARRTPHSRLAATLGISTEHLRHVLRQHPRPQPAPARRRVLVPAPAAGSPAAGHQPGAIHLDPAWLRDEYLTWQRSLPDIAAQLGCHRGVLRNFALAHGIPLRGRSGPRGFAHLDVPGQHPSQIPQPLRSVLSGRNARGRLHRFVLLVSHPSLNQAAQALGCRQSNLTLQLQHLERACGGLLLQRHPRPRPVGPLTPLGEQLHRQALEHLDLIPST